MKDKRLELAKVIIIAFAIIIASVILGSAIKVAGNDIGFFIMDGLYQIASNIIQIG